MEQNFFQLGPGLALAGENFLATPLPEAVSPSMRTLIALVRELGHSSVPVLLIGESGTGKQTIGRRIHQDSGWPVESFYVRNCRELMPESFSSTPFPAKSTLYLNEIGDLTSACQSKLFELLAATGENGATRAEMRIVCGSSRDLDAAVRSGSFQEDLYYRLSAVCLRIPPLRQRREDIIDLMSFFLERYSESYRCPVPELSPETQKLFLEYSWPGNLPELEGAIRTIVAVGDEAIAMSGLRSMLTRSNGKSNGEKLSLKETSRAASREAEKELILKVLARTRWNRRRAAKELQISYKALLYKLKQIGFGEYGAS